MTAFDVDTSTVLTRSCLTMTINEDCNENVDDGHFSVLFQKGFRSCQTEDDIGTPLTIDLAVSSVCLPLNDPASSNQRICYEVTLKHQQTVIESQRNHNFDSCSVSELESFLDDDVSSQLDGPVLDNTVSHFTIATLSCQSSSQDLLGTSQSICINGVWSTTGMRSCTGKVKLFWHNNFFL